mmetsp:Transcript_13776/g.32143  ORF Transcript_13776/g.32143 Transcript_13776/m.32143 type:complete len:283 (-) Transcript_13776:1150-1998(-)
MNVERRNPAAPGDEPLDHGLFHQVVDAHVLLIGDKQEGLVGMETRHLGFSLGLAEGLLRISLAQLVDEDGRGSRLGADRHKVISLGVPSDLGHLRPGPERTDGTAGARKGTDGGFLLPDGYPLDGLGCLGRAHVATPLGRGKEGLRHLGVALSLGTGGNHDGALSDGRQQAVVGAIGVPFQRHHGLDNGLRFVSLTAVARMVVRIGRQGNLGHIPALEQAAGFYLPQANETIGGTTRHKFAIGTGSDATNHRRFVSLVGSLVSNALGGGEGSQVARLGKFGN